MKDNRIKVMKNYGVDENFVNFCLCFLLIIFKVFNLNRLYVGVLIFVQISISIFLLNILLKVNKKRMALIINNFLSFFILEFLITDCWLFVLDIPKLNIVKVDVFKTYLSLLLSFYNFDFSLNLCTFLNNFLINYVLQPQIFILLLSIPKKLAVVHKIVDTEKN